MPIFQRHSGHPGVALLIAFGFMLVLMAACGNLPADTPASQEVAATEVAGVATTLPADPATTSTPDHSGTGAIEDDHDDEEHAAEHADIATLIAALTPIAEGATLEVVATTSIIGDVVGQVGGENIHLITLIPLGADPHTFEPTPQDITTVAEADVVFVNGLGLEETLEPLIENSGIPLEHIISMSTGITTIEFQVEDNDEHSEEEEEDHAHSHSGDDPHTWMSPVNVMIWTETIAAALSALDPANAASYTANAASYTAELEELDTTIREQIAQIPADNRELVTDHTAFGYYTNEYGLKQIGAVIPAYSTLAEPSAQDLAALQDAIAQYTVPAIFVGTTVNPAMAEQIARDTGIKIMPVYTGSLSEPGGKADSYLALMRYNTAQLVEGLSGR